MPHGSVGMRDGLFIVVLHPSFGYDHDFSVVLRPIVMMHFQPYLWFHAFQKQRRYLYKHFASYFLCSVPVLLWLSCVCEGWGVSQLIHMSPTEQSSSKCDFCLHLRAHGKPHALDQVRLTEGEQRQTTMYSQNYENYMMDVRNEM